MLNNKPQSFRKVCMKLRSGSEAGQPGPVETSRGTSEHADRPMRGGPFLPARIWGYISFARLYTVRSTCLQIEFICCV